MIKRVLFYIYLLAPFIVMGQAIQFGTLGGGFSNQTYNAVRALYYDTLTGKLYAGGQFNLTEGKPVWGAAVWNGSNWDSLTGGLTKFPHQPVTINTAGPVVWRIIGYKGKIYYLGGFDWVNGKNQYNMGVWNGSNWDYPLLQPLSANNIIYDMKVHNGILYACGDFTAIGSIACNYVARFDGVNWQPIGDFSKFHLSGHPPAQMNAIEIYNNEVYVGGAFDDTMGVVRNIAKFDGTNWVNVGSGIQQGGINSVFALKTYNNKLYIGGYFSKTIEIPSPGLITWDGNSYGRATSMDLDHSGNVNNFIIHKGKLVVSGNFTSQGSQEALYLLFIDTTGQCSIRNMQPTFSDHGFCVWTSVASMGDTLVIGGQFNYIDTIPAKNIATIVNYENSTNCVYTGIGEIIDDNIQLKIYPNPTSEYLTLELNGIDLKRTTLNISNTLGQIIYSKINLDQKEKIDLGHLEAGVYFLKFQGPEEHRIFKMIKE